MPKPKKCSECGSSFEPSNSFQKVCTPACGIRWAKANPDKGLKANKRVEGIAKRARSRQRRERLKEMETVTDCLNAAQRQVNRYVVYVRDKNEGCISCGTRTASKYDAGHFRTRKAASHLRFHLDNIFKQCSRPCNMDLSGNILEMEKGMIARIGKERVEAIKNDNRIHKWTKEEARAIEAEFKELNKQIDRD